MIIRIAAALLVLAGCAHAYAYRAFQPDDAFIFLVYVKNLLAGHDLTFNGEVVEGYSSVLWTFLLAAVGALRFDLLLTAKVLGTALYVACGVALVVMARRIGAREGRSAIAPLGLLAMFFAMPLLAMWAPGGLETVLHAFMLTLACYLYFDASMVTRSVRGHAIAGVAFGLLAWTRPEGFAFLGAIPAFEIGKVLMRQRIDLRNIAVTLAGAIVMIALLLVWRWSAYQELMPVTVAAKTGDLSAQWSRGSDYVARFFSDYAAYAVAYALATVALLWRGGRAGWWAWMALIVVTGETLFSAVVGGDWMLGYRFLVPVVPIALLVIFLAVQPSRIATAAATIALVGAGLYSTVPLNRAALAQAESDMGDVRMGMYIRDLRLPPDTHIAVIDAGAIPYYTGLPTIDMVGLNNAHIAKLPGGFMGKWDNEYVLSHKPEVVQFHTYIKDGAVFPSEVFLGTMRLFYSPEFQRAYEHDAKSPVAHLFRRRATPAERTWMDTFFDAALDARPDPSSSRLSVDLRKTGEGIWLAPTDLARTQGGMVYVRSRLLDADGLPRFEQFTPIAKDMRRGDAGTLDIALPKSEHRQAQVCLVLVGIADFPGCKTVAVQ